MDTEMERKTDSTMRILPGEKNIHATGLIGKQEGPDSGKKTLWYGRGGTDSSWNVE